MEDKNNNETNNVASDFDNIIASLPTSKQNEQPIGKQNNDQEKELIKKPDLPKQEVTNNDVNLSEKETITNSINNKDEINIMSNNDDLPKSNNNESTIGKLKPDKQKSPISMLVLFGLLVIFIIFMPQIIELANKFLGTNLEANAGVSVETSNKTTTNTSNTTNEVDNTLYDFSDSLIIKIDNFELSNFTKSKANNNYMMTFDIKNNSSSDYTFTKKLYIDFYNSTKTFISRTLWDNSDILASNSTTSAKINITSDDYEIGYKLAVVFRSSDDYPAVNLDNNLLTCTTSNDKILYYFDSNKLIKINETLSYVKGDDPIVYSNDLMNYKQIVSKLDALDGVESALTETTTGFIISIVIDYNSASYSALSYKTNIYDKNTLAKVINFEMGAKYYTCK